MSEETASEILRRDVQALCDPYRIGIKAEALDTAGGQHLIILEIPRAAYNRVTLDPLVKKIEVLAGVETVTVELKEPAR